jgi:hypothetical protein
MDAILKMDDAIIAYLNSAYLWIWDRTGITVAMIAFPAWVITTFIIFDMNLSVFGLCLFAIIGGFMTRYHYLQSNGFFEVFNYTAQLWHVSFMRRGFNVCSLVITIIRLFEGRYMMAIVDLLSILVMQFLCVKIRKREPPEKHVFAPQGAN